MTALLGRAPAEFLADGDLWYRHIHPDDVERVVAETARVFRDGDAFNCEYRVVATDGSERMIWERDAIVRDDAGTPLYTQGVIVDISELRAAEQTVRVERDRAQRYLDVAGTARARRRPARARSCMLNRAGHELLGRPEGALLGCDWIDTCVPAAEREHGARRLRAAARRRRAEVGRPRRSRAS